MTLMPKTIKKLLMGYHKKHKENEVKADYWFESNLREYNKYVAQEPGAIFCLKCLGSDVQHYSR